MIDIDIDIDIQNDIVVPIEKMLEGENTPEPLLLPTDVRWNYITWCEEHRLFYKAAKAKKEYYLSSVCGYVKYCRDHGDAEELARAMAPLYIEYLVHPSERMRKYSFENYTDDVSLLEKRMEATCCISRILSDELYVDVLLERVGIIRLIEGCAESERLGFHVAEEFMHCLIEAAISGCHLNWSNLYNVVKAEISGAPANFVQAKLEYCCRVMAVIMVMRREGLDSKTRRCFLRQLNGNKVWPVLFSLYSVATQKVLGSRLQTVQAVIGNFLSNDRPYTHLLVACINHMNGKFSPQIQNKINSKRSKIEQALKTDQNEDLDELYTILFPKSEIVGYVNDTPHLTSYEKENMLNEARKRNEELAKALNDMKVELSALRPFREAAMKMAEGVSFEDFQEMFKKIVNPEKAKQLFMELDFHLRRNEAWMKHRNELADLIEEKFDLDKQSRNRLADAIEKNTQAPRTVNQFESGSVNVNAGGTLTGDVNLNGGTESME